MALNSNIGIGADSDQLEWLADDLAANPTLCSVAYWHHPRFSSGFHGSDTRYDDLWWVLYEAGVEVVINGHEHSYERFAPQTPGAVPDPDRGIRELVVGTGGYELRAFGEPVANSEARNNDTYGVLKLSLYESRYEWEFVPITPSGFTDSGEGDCHL